MSRLRHLWGVARHRIPLHTHDKIQQLRVDGKLHIIAGKIVSVTEAGPYFGVEFFDKKEGNQKNLEVSRIINCTGPSTDIVKSEDLFLKNCLSKGIITQDKLRLGLRTNTETFEVLNAEGESQAHIYTLGANLKGVLWESTAVNELRVQAEKLASRLCS